MKILQSQGEGELFGALEVNQGAEEIIPDSHESEEGDDRQCGAGEGEDDSAEDAKLAATVDARGFGKLTGDRQEELAEEEDVEC